MTRGVIARSASDVAIPVVAGNDRGKAWLR